MSRVPGQRVHTGTFVGDQMQRTAQQAARKVNEVAESTKDHKTRIDTLERRAVGALTLSMGNANYTMTNAQSLYPSFRVSDAATASRNLTVPRATDEGAYFFWITNTTGQNVVITNVDGSATVATATTRCVRVSASGPQFMV